MSTLGMKLPRRGPDLSGRRFGRLAAIDRHEQEGKPLVWRCLCDCGIETFVPGSALLSGRTKSCGCVRRPHGLCTSATYSSWTDMRRRCEDEKRACYPDYGGRGIRVCERWLTFQNFLADMGEMPAGTTIDRIDNDGNYEPGNCRWATRKQQSRNKRNSRLLTAFGETKCVADWVDDPRCSVGWATINTRLLLGWSDEKAISTPARAHNKNAGQAILADTCPAKT